MGQSQIPQAKVVKGRHSPHWTTGSATDFKTTYEQKSSLGETALTVLIGLWPITFIALVGISMLWSAAVYGAP